MQCYLAGLHYVLHEGYDFLIMLKLLKPFDGVIEVNYVELAGGF